jgi:hypothetical protein
MFFPPSGRGRSLRGETSWLLSLACVLTTVPAGAQVVYVRKSELGAFAIGRGLGRSIAGAVNAAGEARRNANEFTKDIVEVRRQFWQAYPDKPGFAELDKKFFNLLQSKDFYYMVLAMPEGPGSPSARLAERVAGVDRGIRRRRRMSSTPGSGKCGATWAHDPMARWCS